MYSPSYTLRSTLRLNVTEYKHTPNYKAVKGGIDSCPVVLVLLLPIIVPQSQFFFLSVFDHFRHHYDKNHYQHHHHNHIFHQHNQLELDFVILA